MSFLRETHRLNHQGWLFRGHPPLNMKISCSRSHAAAIFMITWILFYPGVFSVRSFNIITSLIILSLIFNFSLVYANLPPTPYPDPQRVPKVEGEIRVDGKMDEGLWDQALKLDVGFEVRPSENIPAPVKTEVFLAYTESYVFVGIKAYDPDPSQIRARINDRDDIWDDDWAGILFDTFNDERRSYDFLCNPLGVQSDFIEGLGINGGELDLIWDSKGLISDMGYTVEMAIPFSSLRFQRKDGDQIWGFDCVRSYPRSVRHHLGVFPRDRDNNNYWSQTVKLTGFEGASPGRNIEIDPTVSGLISQEREEQDDDTYAPMKESGRDFEPGVSANWGITPNLTFGAAINPDFAQVEADAAQLDVNTQYALYYSEQRPFFLEGSDFFDTRLNAVHTRTLSDPNWGVKLTGKEGPNTVGFFTVEDSETNLMFPYYDGSEVESMEMKSTGSAFRYKRDLGESSSLGMLVTDREGEEYFNRVASIDGEWRFTKTKRISVQYMRSETDYPGGLDPDLEQDASSFGGSALDINFLHGTNNLDYYASLRQLDEDFRADLGFIPQIDFRYMTAGWGYTWWSNDNEHWWNMLNLGNGYEFEESLDGSGPYKKIEMWANYSGPRETHSDFYCYVGRQNYDGQIFEKTYFNWDASTHPNRDLMIWAAITAGRQIDYANSQPGTLFALSAEMEYKLGKHVDIGFDHDYEQMQVSDGWLYHANISRLRTVYNFSRRAFFRAVIQYVNYDYHEEIYDDEDQESIYENFFTQLLFSYKINPQTVFYLGYSDSYNQDENLTLIQSNKTIFAKLGYAFVL